MTRKEEMLHELRQRGEPLCDDCVSSRARFPWRQIANQLGRALAAEQRCERARGPCSDCGKVKLVNRIGSGEAVLPVGLPFAGAGPTDPPWYREGEVQRRLLDWLTASGFVILRSADTVPTAAGEEILAVAPDGREVWITCRGYPAGTGRTRPQTQAGHRFSQAMLDVVRFRTARPGAVLGVGLPDGFTAYEALARSVEWLRKTAPFTFYWVAADGSVRQG